MINRITLKAGVAPLALGLAISAAPAFAQTTDQDALDPAEQTTTEGAIVVTGSRITNPNLEQSSPVAVVTAEEIGLQQPVSVEQFLRELPGTASGISAPVNNGSNGTATFNLRGLGSNRNLVLLNSRRLTPAGLNGVADLNNIPIALLERVDVFTGGASSTYGADAIAGVANFITKQDFAGVDLNGLMGITERGDGRQMRIDATIGANFDDGRGNAVLGVSYTETLPVFQGNREIGLVSRSSATGADQGSNTAVPASLFFPLPATGPIGTQGGQFDPATGTIVAGLSNYNFNPINYFQTPLDRWSIFGSARYEITPQVEMFAEAFYTRSRVVQQLAPTGTFTNQFQVPLNNQFLTPAQRTQLCQFAVESSSTGAIPGGFANCPAAIAGGAEITAIVARRFVEGGGRVGTFNSNTFQVVAGLRGELTSTLDWEISGQYGETERIQTSTGGALADRVQQGLRGCPAGSTPGCVPINIFGAAGTLSQASLDFIGVPTNTFTFTELGAAQAVISGDLGFASPFAEEPIGIALGAEYRRYAGNTFGDLPSSTAGAVLGAGGAFTAVSGEYDTRELFAEIIAPLVEDVPFIYNLTVEAGYRMSDYSTSGTNHTYKFGGSYSPIPDLKIRGVYSRAVRAPNLGELFSPINTVLNNRTTDPCQLALPVGNATLTALCAAQLAAVGLPASRVGSIPAPIAGQINVTGGGNPNLEPEVADTYTVGVVLQPSFLSGFTATADFYSIIVNGAVSSPGVSDVLDACIASGSPTNPACGLIFRNPLTGGLSGAPDTTRGIILQSSNLGRIESRGIDFTASYLRQFGDVNVGLSFIGTYVLRSRFQSTPNGINRECVNRYSASCDPILPEFSANTRLTLGYEGSNVSLLWRHINGTEVEPRAPTPQVPVGQPTTAGPATVFAPYQSIPSYDYFDLAFRQSVGENMEFTFLIENLADRGPPDVGNTVGSTGFNSGNTYPVLYDALGRRYTVGVNLRF